MIARLALASAADSPGRSGIGPARVCSFSHDFKATLRPWQAHREILPFPEEKAIWPRFLLKLLYTRWGKHVRQSQGTSFFVRIGLRLSYFGTFIAAAFALPGLFCLFGVLIFGGERGKVIGVAAYAVLGTILSALFVSWIGRCLCCAVPVASGARNQAVSSATCLTAAALIGGAWLLLLWTGNFDFHFLDGLSRRGRDVLLFMAGLLVLSLHIIGHVLFVLALRNIGLYFRGEAQTTHARVYLSTYGFLMSVYSVLAVLAALVDGFTALACVLSLALGTSGLLLFVLFLFLVGSTFDLIDDALKRAAC